jgi:hypothetical protein
MNLDDTAKKRAVALSQKFHSWFTQKREEAKGKGEGEALKFHMKAKTFSCIFATSLSKRSAKCKWHLLLMFL